MFLLIKKKVAFLFFYTVSLQRKRKKLTTIGELIDKDFLNCRFTTKPESYLVVPRTKQNAKKQT